ncbi:M24 family metallopeptidase [Thalassococcus sp. BH17M4-6]|uniref:M24 family metallopeptidase n=1 Tax=Thalassococcus sp. BH17M4-6 TaxID=3413148 RepID=UPI003BD0D134
MTLPAAECAARTRRAQALMAQHDLAALLLTTEPEVRYFTGFLTRFWESPTRPWFVIVPASGDPIAVIPEIGAALMLTTWISDIRTWISPDLDDDGVTLLAQTLQEVAQGDIGLPFGPESHLRMPLADYHRLTRLLAPQRLVSDHGILRQLRMVKSEAEIARIAAACDIAGRAFARVPEVAQPGVPLAQVFRRFQVLCLEEGADWVPYLAGASDPGGYADVISPATEAPLAPGDVLMLDTGLVHAGYFCDFDRNYSVGPPAPPVREAHARLIDATRVGFEAAKPGATAAELFSAMNCIVNPGGDVAGAGRLGHGLGMQLTEWPSLIPTDHTVLAPGMVLTLEPGIEVSPGKLLVHEENIVIREDGAHWLSPPAGPEMTVLT